MNTEDELVMLRSALAEARADVETWKGKWVKLTVDYDELRLAFDREHDLCTREQGNAAHAQRHADYLANELLGAETQLDEIADVVGCEYVHEVVAKVRALAVERAASESDVKRLHQKIAESAEKIRRYGAGEHEKIGWHRPALFAVELFADLQRAIHGPWTGKELLEAARRELAGLFTPEDFDRILTQLEEEQKDEP